MVESGREKMTQITTVLLAMVSVGMAATVLSKDANTPKVLDSIFGGLSKFQATNMGYAAK
jgi:hypothetical protein